jgi:hypothetical protein
MFKPTAVTEVSRRFEPITRDPFLDGVEAGRVHAIQAADAHERQRALVVASLVRIPGETEGARR